MVTTERERTQLFTLRVWEEEVAQKEQEIRFKLQHVVSGEVRYFRDWSMAVAFCEEKLRGNDEGCKTKS